MAGEAVTLPSIVHIDSTGMPPASNDIEYWTLWQEPWHDLNVNSIEELWMDR